MKRKLKINKKNKNSLTIFVSALVVGVILGGLVFTSELVNKPQDIRSRADEIVTCTAVQQVNRLYVRQTYNNGKNWGDWQGPNSAVTAGNGLINSFSAWLSGNGVTRQQAVRGNDLLVRSLDRSGRWSNWTTVNSDIPPAGTGTITSFSSHFFNHPGDLNGKVRQYAVKGGKLYVRTSTSEPATEPIIFGNWSGPNSAVDRVGEGVLTGFSSYEGFQTGSYENKQYAVKGGELWVRTSKDNKQWSAWTGPNSAADTAGRSGKLLHFATFVEGLELKQYAVKEEWDPACDPTAERL